MKISAFNKVLIVRLYLTKLFKSRGLEVLNVRVGKPLPSKLPIVMLIDPQFIYDLFVT